MDNYNTIDNTASLLDAYSSYNYKLSSATTATTVSATAYTAYGPATCVTYQAYKSDKIWLEAAERFVLQQSPNKNLTERELDDLVDFDESDQTPTTTTSMTNTIECNDLDNTAIADEKEITDFHRGTVDNPFLFKATKAELEKFLLTCVFVAGKNASVQQKKLDQFVDCVRRDLGSYSTDNLGVISTIYNALPVAEIADRVDGWLKEVKSGQYSRIGGCIVALCDKIGAGKISTTGCNRGNLSAIKGIGYKTASFYLLYTRHNWGGACLDTHILRWLREDQNLPNIPEVTPHTKEEYIRVENIFLKVAEKLKKSVPDLDFEIWSKYRK